MALLAGAVLVGFLGFSMEAGNGRGGAQNGADQSTAGSTQSSSVPTAGATPTVDPNAPRVITFDGSRGTAPDSDVWNYETGGGGWGNGELETYTRSTQNAFLDGAGHLVIRVLHAATRGTDGITRQFSSARITTAGKVVIQPGSYVSATFTAPVGAGVWPAFWLIGANVDEVGWPRSGELDVFEGNAPAPNLAQSAIHLPSASSPSADKPFGSSTPGGTVDVGQSLDAAPHEYGVYFDGDVVRFFIDRKQNMVVTAEQALASDRLWPFGKPQYLILNVAIDRSGASFDATFPQDLTVYNISIWSHGVPFPIS
jgi:beta-glucanase (GH16 family)